MQPSPAAPFLHLGWTRKLRLGSISLFGVSQGLLKIAQAFKPGISLQTRIKSRRTAENARIYRLLYKN